MEGELDISRLDALVGRIFRIEDRTLGNPEKDFLVRYRGRLFSDDSAAAYDVLAEQLRPLQITPLFRQEDGRHAIVLVPGRPQPRASNPLVNLWMFLATLLSVLLVGGIYSLTEAPRDWLRELPAILWRGWPFAVSLLAILGAHEFGHYLMGKRHGVHVTLPYFIPLPISPFGTMGAVINMKEPAKNRRHLLDIGLAGPLAGLAVAIPVVLIGLSLSLVEPLPVRLPPGSGLQLEGNSVLYLGLKYIVFGKLLPAPATFGGLPEWQYWLRFFFTGQPYPLGGMDVMLHPVAWAGWAGILVTALNLIPVGQFDGGHILYVLVGRRRALQLLPVILGAIAVLGFFWMGWWLWLALMLFLGRFHAEPLDQITPLDSGRRWLAVFAIIVFLLVFTPVPISMIGSL